MEIRLKPLVEEGEEPKSRPARMHPEPAVLTPEHVAEARSLCERVIQAPIKKKRAYTPEDVLWAVNRRFLSVRRPWLGRALPVDEVHRLAQLHAEEAGWEILIIEWRDWRTRTLCCPSRRSCRAWLRYHLPGALARTSRRRPRGKRGRPPKQVALARFAIARRRRKPSMTWQDIVVEWNDKHPNGHVTVEMARSAARRWQGRLGRRRAK